MKLFRPILLLVIIFSLFFASFTQYASVSATPIPEEGAMSAETDIEDGDRNNGCAVGFVGWIFCNAAILLSKLADGMFAVLQHLLYIEPLSRESEGGAALYDIWNVFRSIANVIFIILFLIIIYSQITGFGMSNYNIKRILPRLVVNIILINTSYYIGILIVDIANILGASLKDVLDSIASSIETHPRLAGFGNVATLILGLGTVAILIYIFASSLLPLFMGAIVMLFAVVLILIARQALVIALIIISPIAFALNTLPNTQKWFSKWWNALFTTAMIYPIVALVVGGGSVAANIIRAGAGSSTDIPTMAFALLGVAAEVVPLVMVPRLIRSSSSALSGIASAANKITSKAFSPLTERSQLFAERKQLERKINNFDKKNIMGVMARTESRMKKSKKDVERELSRGGNDSTYPTTMDRFDKKYEDEIAKAGAAGIVDKEERLRREDEIKKSIQSRLIQLDFDSIEAAVAYIKEENLSTKDIHRLANDPSTHDHLRSAAFFKLGESGSQSVIDDAFESIRNMQGDITTTASALIDGVKKSGAGANSAHLDNRVLNEIGADPSRLHEEASAKGSMQSIAAKNNMYTPDRLSRETAANIDHLGHMSETGALSEATVKNLQSAREQIKSSSGLSGNMGQSARKALENAHFESPRL